MVDAVTQINAIQVLVELPGDVDALQEHFRNDVDQRVERLRQAAAEPHYVHLLHENPAYLVTNAAGGCYVVFAVSLRDVQVGHLQSEVTEVCSRRIQVTQNQHRRLAGVFHEL